MFDLAVLHAALLSRPDLADLRLADFQALPAKGLAHLHLRLARRGRVLRVPLSSQIGLSPADNLLYQAACFERAAPSGVTPRLHACLPVAPGLPFGALLVEEIVGRPPRLPDELPALAESLSRIHDLPLPAPEVRPPLNDFADPFAATLAAVERQTTRLPGAGLSRPARSAIEEEITWARDFARDGSAVRSPRALIATDTHPGNFLIRPDGKAILVDLEKSAYGSPAIDLAHASLRPSTNWDPDCGRTLSPSDTLAFYRDYLDRIGRQRATALCPWLLPMRRLTWLRTITFFIRFRVEREAERLAGSVDPAVLAHVADCIAANLDAAAIQSVRREWSGPNPLPLAELCS
ncbi:MAG: aminoglycoside phosphotransferase [Rhodospirillaceae bacterium]|nr:aminoglycoside phosphotransferase [Rhodospirillaceae bacterium]